MTARALALDLFLAVEGGRRLQPTLSAFLRRHALSPEDRAFLTHLAYGVFRRLRYLDHLLDPLLPRPERLPSRVRWALRAGAFEFLEGKAGHARVHPWVEEVKKTHPALAGLANAVLRRLALREAPLAVRLSLPDFLLEAWEAFFQEVEFAQAFNEPAPLFVTALGKPDGAKDVKEKGERGLRPGPLPDSFVWEGPAEDFPALGLQPQNPASLFAAQLLGAGPGEEVLDLCGGAGVKAAYLASRGARVRSLDVNARRQRAGERTWRRLGLEVAFETRDLREPIPYRADKVLLDAPCTGTGTFRTHPEARYRLKPEEVRAMAALQTQLLETAAQATRPGGVLVYSVCTLTEEEGEGVVRAFLERHPEFVPEDFACPLPLLRQELGAYVRPEGGLDGFYYARLRRVD
ncbi:RsmB/NOP family class I SAM-dependent RNA methyltransferase [Thermus filiformis]|uniref:MFS transporter n=1 Tax=Thermus filiformis TaxID=276 RepID=A0A0A2XD84_THEFI|nr:transcription antitermination factor NusB [Thermus filiformis]KGQ23104.1 MFS transporter [Thermus filiformis]